MSKSKISDIDFSSMESNVNKSMELTDAAENFDGQIKAFHSAKSSMEESTQALIEAKSDMNTARLRLDNAATNANAAADTISCKVDELKKTRIKSEVEPNEWLRLTNLGKTYIEGVENTLKSKNDELQQSMTRHYYDMSNLLSRNEGLWISGTWSKVIMYISIGCFLYTVVTIAFFIAMAFGK